MGGIQVNTEARSINPPEIWTRISHDDLFRAFLKVGLLGFGGVAAWVRQILVEERHWLSDPEFAEWLGIASILPGANTVNIAVMLGDRSQGFSGAIAALSGLLLAPLLILIGFAALYTRFSGALAVERAMEGAAAATAGLVIGNACKMLRNMKPDKMALILAAVTFLSAGLLRLPSASVLCVIAPVSLVIGLLTTTRHFHQPS